MKPTRRLILLMIATAALTAPVARAAEPALEGLYTAQGFNPDGTEYRGVVQIARRGEGFTVAWLFPHLVGEEMLLVLKSAGVGLMSGGTLAVSYYGQDATGIALYQVEGGGQRLIGRWASANGAGTVQTETLTKLAAPAATPDTEAPLPPEPKKRAHSAVLRTIVASR
ncbi:MAG: hypothetical protein ACRD3G_04565 [Vicinamibacterales bacterium]